MSWEPVIGLEVHIQLATQRKLFCRCRRAAPRDPPNSAICEICSGQPGAMPWLDQEAVNLALRLAHALGANIRAESRFARKHYFYPDLPKGYQITQYERPLATGGALVFDAGEAAEPLRRREVPLSRLHLEEDAGKAQHLGNESVIDLNRAGVALVELVSEPVLRSADEAAAYLRALRCLVRWLGVSDGNLEEGSLRCDANISLRLPGEDLGVRTELKNLNSFRHVKHALEAETRRQKEILDAGGRVQQQTRGWDAKRGMTTLLRSKEEAEDYRYFDEPDLPPLRLPAETIAQARGALPELPLERQERLFAEHCGTGLSRQLTRELCREELLADTFEALVAEGVTPRRAATWLTTEILARLSDPRELASAPLTLSELAELLRLIDRGRLTQAQGKELLEQLWSGQRDGLTVEEQARASGLLDCAVDQAEMTRLVETIIAEHPAQVRAYRGGKGKLLGWFMGQAQRRLAGAADPATLRRMLSARLTED